jgi:hypothetical protein
MYHFFNKKNFFYYLLILFTLVQFNFFLNSFIVIKKNYSERMNFFAGYCDRQGYGFVEAIYKEKKFLENVLVNNFNNQPNVHGHFYNIKKKDSEKFIILIGAQSSQLNTFVKKDYKIIEQYNNCYLMKKND